MGATNYLPLVYTTQVNSASCAFWLASTEMNSKYYSPPSKRKKNKMASWGANIIDKRGGCSKIYKIAAKFGLIVFNVKFFNFSELKILSQNHVTLCAQKNRAARFPLFLLLEIIQILHLSIIQHVRYTPKQLFTSVLLKVVDIDLLFGE